MRRPMTEPPDDSRLARATLEMETDHKAPGGAVITTDGHRFAFSGWAEMGAAIEAWREAAAADGTVTSESRNRT